jgi:hypothetical protein
VVGRTTSLPLALNPVDEAIALVVGADVKAVDPEEDPTAIAAPSLTRSSGEPKPLNLTMPTPKWWGKRTSSGVVGVACGTATIRPTIISPRRAQPVSIRLSRPAALLVEEPHSPLPLEAIQSLLNTTVAPEIKRLALTLRLPRRSLNL